MNKSTPFRLYAGLAIAILIVVSVAALTMYSLREQDKQNKWVHHTVAVLQKIRDIRYQLIQMRGGRRSYWFTGEENFLESFNIGKSVVPAGIDDLKELISDNPPQLALVNKLDSATGILLTYWSGRGNLVPSVSREQAASMIGEEEIMLSAIYQVFEQLKAEEQRLLSLRENSVTRSNDITQLVVISGIVLLLIVVLILVNAVVSTLKSRIRAGKRLKENLDEMETLNKLAQDKNWVLMGGAHITDSIQSIDGKNDLSKDIIESLVTYMELPAGAIYLHDEETGTLVMQAAVAVSGNARTEFKTGEGIVGAAALKRSISLFKDIPAEYWRIESAMGTTSGKGEIACIPLWVAENLKGIIELGSLNSFSERQLQLLEAISNSLATAIHTRQSRIRINHLLEQVQEQREAMISQQEELRQTNEELSRQTQELLSSEEELRTQEEELKQINAELLEKNQIVEQARGALVVKAQELEATSRYKSEFLANMSHELRTPLNSVLILAKLLSDNKPSNLTDKQIEYANIIHKSGSDLLQLINDILDLSKIEAGKIDILPEEVQLENITTDLKQLFTVIATEKNITYTIAIHPTLPAAIYTDQQRLEQVLKNLLSNAFKFTPANGSVRVAFEPHGERLAISVTDSGIGISPAQQQLIFDAFQQADGSTSRQYGGTGLGLSISRELMRLLGGEITLRSEEGKGSTFTVLLPFHLDSSNDIPKPDIATGNVQMTVSLNNVHEQQRVEDDRSTLGSEMPSMLIIEDDANFATILKDFARSKGYQAIVALTGDEGLLYARRYRPAAIILDIQLPVVDGWSLLKILKADETLKDIPVHIISAFDDNRLHTAGALAYLKKPVDREGLEKAFSSIGDHLRGNLKKVLIISANHFRDDSLEVLFRQQHPDTVFEHVSDTEAARAKIAAHHYDCVIADIDSNIPEGVNNLRAMEQALSSQQVPLIVYLDTDISAADELLLKKVSDVIVRESPSVNDRLKDELELFLYRLQAKTVSKTPATVAQPIKTADNLNDAALSGKTVLVVDDDMRNVFALSNLLEAQQMTVLTAADGREAVDTVASGKHIDIVLMDIMMPEMDGYEAMTRIRGDLHRSNLPIIALTAKAMAGDREKCIAAGASDYITKPVDTQKLLSQMRVWLAE